MIKDLGRLPPLPALLPKSRSERLGMAGIGMIAFLVRLLHLLELKKLPWFETPIMDAGYHDLWAMTLLKGELWQPDVYFRGPLYPTLLAGLYLVLGRHMLWVRLCHVFMGSVTCILLSRLAQTLFGRTAGLLTGLIAALYGMFVFFDVDLLIPVLILHLNLWFIFFLYQAVRLQSKPRWFLSGLFMGLSAIARPNILMVAPVPLLWPFLTASSPLQALKRKTLSHAAIFLLGVVLPICPVTLRNGIVADDFMLISSQGGINLFIGNNPESNGIECYVPGARNTWWGGFQDYHRLAEEAVGRPLKASEASSYWYKRALDFMWNQPTDALDLMMAKTFHFWSAPEIGNNTGIYFFRYVSRVLRVLIWLTPWVGCPFGLLMPFAFAGLCMALPRFRHLFPLYGFIVFYAASIILFYVNARYRLPVIPFLIVFASAGIVRLFDLAQKKRWKQLLPLGFGMLTVFSMVNRNPFRKAIAFEAAQGFYDLGVAFLNEGRYQEAEETFLAYRKMRPQSSGPYIGLGAVYLAQGQLERSEQQYREALLREPTSSRAHMGLAGVASLLGDEEALIQHTREALRSDPHSPEASFTMGSFLASKGQWEEAESWLKRSLAVNPSQTQVWEILAHVLQEQGRSKEAEGALKKAAVCQFGRGEKS